MKKAIITGITGQDGSYLAEFLLAKGYEVHGVVRRTSSIQRGRLDHLFSNPSIYQASLFFHYSDLNDLTSLRRIFSKVQPEEIYHLAGQSHVGLSFDIPEVTSLEVGFSLVSLLEIVRDENKSARFFHASSSEIFGVPNETPQTENTSFRPVSPYGVAKTFATNMVRVYRESYGMFLVNGIMYNHESPRRGESFVTKKICRSAALIAAGKQKEIVMGNLSSSRDWGHAKDFVEGMWLSLQHEQPDDYIFSTGIAHSLEHVLDVAFSRVGLHWHDFYRLDQRFLRPSESKLLVGDSSKARAILEWDPKYSLEETINEMVDHEIERVKGVA